MMNEKMTHPLHFTRSNACQHNREHCFQNLLNLGKHRARLLKRKETSRMPDRSLVTLASYLTYLQCFVKFYFS